MQNIFALNIKSKKVGYLMTDIIVITFIFLIPSLSHLTSIPFYLFEPMRLAAIFCVINTNRTNSLVIAFILPVVSFIISSHPELVKGILISLELIINVILFYFFNKRFKNKFFVMLFSILIAKLFYYTSKFSLLSLEMLKGDLVSTPFWIQWVIIILLSIYTVIAMKNKQEFQIGDNSF
jgi:hypothetical protein